MRKIQAYALFNENSDGPLSGIYPDRQSLNRQIKRFPNVTWKSYPWIWTAFLELEDYYRNRTRSKLIIPHEVCSATPCVHPGRIEYRCIDPKVDRVQKYYGSSQYTFNWSSVGVLVDEFDSHALCKLTFCRYTIYADAIIPLSFSQDFHTLCSKLCDQKFREKYRIYAIVERVTERSLDYNRILYTDTKVWDGIPGD